MTNVNPTFKSSAERIRHDRKKNSADLSHMDKASPSVGNVQQTNNGKQDPSVMQKVVEVMTVPPVGFSTWPKPQPLNTSLLPVLPVTPAMIPESLRPWLTDVSYRMKCPIEFVTSAAIVMLSSLIGTRLAIKPKEFDDWTVMVNLWGAAIGDPSTMKTPSISEVFRPMSRLIAVAQSKHEEEMRDYESEHASYEAQKKVYQSQEQDRLKGKLVKTAVAFPDPPKKPTERRYMTNDATIEKLADLSNENPAGFLQFRDELIGLLASWDRSGHEQDRAFYLEAWNGHGSVTIDRIGRGTIHVRNVCLSLFGGIQPAKLTGYLKAATAYENDGFVQRLQFAVYPDKSPWEYVDQYPDARARDAAFDVVKRVADVDFKDIGYSVDEYNQFAFTRFDKEAQLVFKQWLINWETDVLPAQSGLLLEHLTKYRSLMPSLALIFHTVDYVSGLTTPDGNGKHLVSARAAQMAVQWCQCLQSHARRIYGLLDTIGVVAAKDLLRHLKAGDLKNEFKVRDVAKKGWAGLSETDSAEQAIAELVSTGWLREVQPDRPTTGRPESPHYLIHPEIASKNVG